MRKITVLFFLGWAVVYADRTVLYPLLPAIGDQFKLTNTQVGAIANAYYAELADTSVSDWVLTDTSYGLHKSAMTPRLFETEFG